MSGWQFLIWGAVSAAGTLVFLKLVADEIHGVTERLGCAREAAIKEHHREIERQQNAAPVVEVVVEGRLSSREGNPDR